MISENMDCSQELPYAEGEAAAKKVCLRNDKNDEREKKIEEMKKILDTAEFSCMQSPTKKVVHYAIVQAQRNYPELPKTVMCKVFNVNIKKFNRKFQKVKNGFPYELTTKCPLFNEVEGKELLLYIRYNAERRVCPTLEQVVLKATQIVSRRRIELVFGMQLDRECVKRWCKEHGIQFDKSWDKYHVDVMSDRESIEKMYQNIHLMMELWNYPPELIANMDESWVATLDLVYSGVVAHPDDCYPIAIAPTDGVHITLIGCITLSGEVVTPAYIIPSELKCQARIERNHLENLVHWVSKSGFMNGDIFALWIDNVLGPWFDRKKRLPGQHALLICDAHTFRTNVAAREALKRHKIDMIVLPAHVTSKHQPLDVGIFSSYKTNLKKILPRVEGGMYGKIWASINAFQCATIPINIFSAWEQSKLFSEDYEDVIETYLPRLPDAKVYKNANYIVPCEPVACL